MFVPAEAFACLESLGKRLLRLDRRERRLKRTGHERGAIIVRHRERLFFAEVKFPGRRIVRHVTARRLRAQPLANVTLGSPRAFCKFCGGLWAARREGFVQTEFVADAN